MDVRTEPAYSEQSYESLVGDPQLTMKLVAGENYIKYFIPIGARSQRVTTNRSTSVLTSGNGSI